MKGEWQLSPTRIDFGRGSVLMAGSYGNGLKVQTRLDKLQLSILDAFIPNLGISGQASGALDFSQARDASFPAAEARLTIANFRRTGLAAVSETVDIVFAGRLVSDGGEARALIRRGQMVVGRMVANLRPLPPGNGGWVNRLMQAPLSGGLRYNGPSAVLFSFAALPNQQLSGPIAVAADFGGRVSAPQLNGLMRADNLTYDNETYGTRLTNMQLAGRFNNDGWRSPGFRPRRVTAASRRRVRSGWRRTAAIRSTSARS